VLRGRYPASFCSAAAVVEAGRCKSPGFKHAEHGQAVELGVMRNLASMEADGTPPAHLFLCAA